MADIVFAVLEPLNRFAIEAFDLVSKEVKAHGECYARHATFMTIHPAPIPFHQAISDSEPRPYISSEVSHVSNSTDATEVDAEDSPANRKVWSGSYKLSLAQDRAFPRIGWCLGYGRSWSRDPTGRTDLILAADYQSARSHGIHADHVRLDFLPESGFFAIMSVHNDFSVALDSNRIQRSDGWHVLRKEQHLVSIGDLNYRFRYTVDRGDEADFQAAKRQHITNWLQRSAPPDMLSVTPSVHDVTIGMWTLLGSAENGATTTVTAGIGDRGEMVAVRMIRSEYWGTDSLQVNMHRRIDELLEGVTGREYVLQLRDVIVPVTGNPIFGFLRDEYMLTVPLTRGTFYSHVKQGTGPCLDDGRLQLFAQAAKGLSALHSKRMIHRNINTMSIGVVSIDPPHAVILGLDSVHFDAEDGVSSEPGSIGTIGYLAPEVEAKDSTYGQAMDVWALGCVGYEVFCGPIRWGYDLNPWRDAGTLVNVDVNDVAERRVKHERVRGELQNQPPRSIFSLIRRMLSIAPEDRGSIETILDHASLPDVKFPERPGLGAISSKRTRDASDQPRKGRRH